LIYFLADVFEKNLNRIENLQLCHGDPVRGRLITAIADHGFTVEILVSSREEGGPTPKQIVWISNSIHISELLGKKRPSTDYSAQRVLKDASTVVLALQLNPQLTSLFPLPLIALFLGSISTASLFSDSLLLGPGSPPISLLSEGLAEIQDHESCLGVQGSADVGGCLDVFGVTCELDLTKLAVVRSGLGEKQLRRG
jgi:hypothetical protein